MKSRKKELLKKVRGGLIALALAVSACGCSKQKEQKYEPENTYIEVFHSDDENEASSKYEYVLDVETVNDDDLNKLFDNRSEFDLLEVVEHEKYTTNDNITERKTIGFFDEHQTFIIPSKTDESSKDIATMNSVGLSNDYYEYSHYKFNSLYGQEYDYYISKVVFKDDSYISINNKKHRVNDGDFIECKILTKDGKIIDYYQTAVGSNIENILQTTDGNLNKSILKLEDVLGLNKNVSVNSYSTASKEEDFSNILYIIDEELETQRNKVFIFE